MKDEECGEAAGGGVLAIHAGALGDVILFGRLLERLDAPVTLVAHGEKARLLEGLGVVRRAMDFESLPMHEVFTDTPLAECELPRRLGRHDRLISCFAAGNRKAELRLAAIAESSACFLPTRPPDGFNGHLLELWCDMLGLPADAPLPAWRVPDEWRLAGAEALLQAGADADGSCTIIHPGAGSSAKCWPAERFRELTRFVANPTFVLGPVELERWPGETVDSIREEFPVLSAPAFATLAGVLADAGAYVGNDSGVSHLAAAVGAPTLALFGPTNPAHFAPLGRCVRSLRTRPLDALTVEAVRQALNALGAQ